MLQAGMLETGIFMNKNKKFTFKALPMEAQFAPIKAIEIADFDGDGKLDLLLGGNFYRVKPEVGRLDGTHGLFLKGNGKHDFKAINAANSGLFVQGEIRDIKRIDQKIIFARNNATLLMVEFVNNNQKKQ